MERRLEVMQDGSRSLILFAVGRKYAHAVAMGEVIRTIKVERGRRPPQGKNQDDGFYLPELRPVYLHDLPYPVRRAARTYLRSGLRKSPRAARILRALCGRGELSDVAAV